MFLSQTIIFKLFLCIYIIIR